MWRNHFDKSSTDKNTIFWLKSAFGYSNNNKDVLVEMFGKVHTQLNVIRGEIIRSSLSFEDVIHDPDSTIPTETEFEDFSHKKGIFYLFRIPGKVNRNRPTRLTIRDSLTTFRKYKTSTNGKYTAKMYSSFIHHLVENLSKRDSVKINSNNFSDLLMDYLGAKDLKKYIPGLKVRRIYLAASDGSVVIYPYPRHLFNQKTVPSKRFRDDQSRFFIDPKSEFNNNEKSDEYSAGLTNIYSDINQAPNVNLTRSYWFRFKDNGLQYFIGLDFWIDNSANANSNALYIHNFPVNPYQLIVLESFAFLALFFIYYFNQKKISKHLAYSNIYKFKRKHRVCLSNSSQIKLETMMKTTYQKGWWESSNFGVEWKVDVTRSQFFVGNDSQSIEGTEVKLTRIIDLSSTNINSMKAIELWTVEESNIAVGFFEIIWYQNSRDDLKINKIYWNVNLYEDIVKNELKNKVLKSELAEFSFNPNLEPEPVDKALKVLKSIPQISMFSQKVDSFSERKFNFDFEKENILEFIRILSKKGSIHAVCSVEFLRRLKEMDKFEKILGIKVHHRVIIETNTEELKTFIHNELSDNQRNFLKNTNFEYKTIIPNTHIACKNKDFLIIKTKYQNIKFVVVTNVSSVKGSSSWISWRQVDTEYYDVILGSLDSFSGTDVKMIC